MVTSRSHTQRATAWLCLVAALLFAAMPAAGVMVCLGHGGHVGIGAAAATDACPCGHDATTEADPITGHAEDDDVHPPCCDIELDPPEACKDADLAQKLPEPEQAPPVDLSLAAAGWVLDGSGSARERVTSPPRAAGASERPREQLEHGRTVCLLI